MTMTHRIAKAASARRELQADLRDDIERLLTVPDVMARTKLSRSKVMEMIARNELPSFTIGRARRIREATLNDWIRQHG